MKKLENDTEKLNYLNEFLEEQLCYIHEMITKNQKVQEYAEGHFQREILTENLETKLWMIQDIQAILKGEM